MTGARVAVCRKADRVVEKTEWGRLVWMVSGAQGNSGTMTVGQCHIDAGQANPRHYHPNCDEVLHVLSGEIRHSYDHEVVTLSTGDTISVPAGTMHNATNVGSTEAVCAISFSSADRQVVRE